MPERKGPLYLPLLLSLLIHILVFAGLSLHLLWPKSVAAKKLLPFRIVSVSQPKPKETLPPDPQSRNLSDANRRESGAGKASDKPKLKREAGERLPALGGEEAPQVAKLAPPPVPPPVPPVKAQPAPPKKPEPKVVPKPTPKVVQKPKPKIVKKPKVVQKPKPKIVRRPKPKIKKKPIPKSEPKIVRKPRPKIKKKPAPEKVQKTKKPEPKKVKVPKKKIPKKIEVASLPKPRKPLEKVIERKPAPRPKPPADPLAMFRRRPKNRGRPENRYQLSDEDLDRIAKASLDKDSQSEEEGEAVSLDTRDYRFVSYFAHIRKRIYETWRWPREARRYTGKLKLRFVLRSDGTLIRVKLLDSSGYKILDDEALSAIAKAAPFKPFPRDIAKKTLVINGKFSYENSPGFYRR